MIRESIVIGFIGLGMSYQQPHTAKGEGTQHRKC